MLWFICLAFLCPKRRRIPTISLCKQISVIPTCIIQVSRHKQAYKQQEILYFFVASPSKSASHAFCQNIQSRNACNTYIYNATDTFPHVMVTGGKHCVPIFCENYVCLFVISPLVPSGGENSSEAAAGVCGVFRVQRAAADTSHHLCGHKERYR